MKWLLFLISAVSWGQICDGVEVTYQPFQLKATQRLFANGREAGLWKMMLDNRTFDRQDVILPRERLLQRIPQVTAFNSDAAIDLLEKRAGETAWGRVKVLFTQVLTVAPEGLGVHGLITGNPYTSGAAAGMLIVKFLVTRSNQQVADPRKYEAQFLQAEAHIPPNGGASYYFAASLMRDAKPIGPICLYVSPQKETAPLVGRIGPWFELEVSRPITVSSMTDYTSIVMPYANTDPAILEYRLDKLMESRARVLEQ